MSQKKKLIQKLKSCPKDFSFEEAESLLKQLGYRRSNKGRTSGSRIAFIHERCAPILLHKPHPRTTLLEYQVKQLICVLEQENLI